MEDDLSNHKVALPLVPDRSGPPTINLAVLLDFAIQHTSHEITILSELLPKKKETDRKISVVQFAHSTRIIFVKLLAIVKWIRMSKKFEPLTPIRYFLHQQATYFEDSADRLVTIARNDLRSARLPLFQVPSAVDVLTLGSFPRFPQDIKDRFICKPSLSLSEQALTLRRLNHVLEQQIFRLSQNISPRIDSIVIRNGMVIIKVTGEFELCLTLLNEAKPLRWCLLNIKVLVECSEIGLGQKLVHPLQINFLHRMVQEKIQLGNHSLNDAYAVMHTFCQSLQLEVLYCQALKMAAISQFYLRVEEYNPAKALLVVSYWLTVNNRKRLTSIYRITIFADSDDVHGGLKTRHRPFSEELPVLDCDHDSLSISRLVGLTIVYRCRERLLRVKNTLESVKPFVPVQLSGNSILTLTYPLISMGKRFSDESLEIAVDSFMGTVVCKVRALGRVDEIVELENQLTSGAHLEIISKTLDRIRILVIIERFNKAICPLQVRTLLNQAIVDTQIVPLLNKIKHFPSDRRILQFNREEQYFLVVTFLPDQETGVVLNFYLVSTNGGKCTMMQLDAVELAKLSPIPTIEYLQDLEDGDVKACDDAKMKWIGSQKQLQTAIAAIDDRLMFLRISEELDKLGIQYDPLAIEPVVGGNILKINNAVPATLANFGVDQKYCTNFFDNLVSCALRLDLRVGMNWLFECTMINCPLVAEEHQIVETENGLALQVVESTNSAKRTSCSWVQGISPTSQTSISEAVSCNIIERLSIYCHIYAPAKRFSFVYNARLRKHCSVQAFTYHKLVLSYGEDRNLLMILSWRPQRQSGSMYSKAQYSITFAQCENSLRARKRRKSMWNPHVTVASALTEKFNQNCDLVGLVCYLINTCKTLDAIYRFSRVRLHSLKSISQVLGIEASFPVELLCYLGVVSETQLRLTYGSSHLEFFLLTDNRVAVRDCTTGSVTPQAMAPMPGTSPQVPSSSQSAANTNSTFEMFWRRMSPDGIIVPPTSTSFGDMTGGQSSSTDFSLEPSLQCQSISNIVVPYETLERAMLSTSEKTSAPLENYLYSVNYLSRLYAVIDASRRASGPNHLPVRDIQYISANSRGDPLSISLTIFGYLLPTMNVKEPSLLRLNIFANTANNFNLSAKLEYSGSIQPNENDIRIYERYFETHVMALFNEMAVLTFITLCRASEPSLFGSFAQLMLAQLEPNTNLQWIPSIQLTLCSEMPMPAGVPGSVAQPHPQRKIQCGVMVNESCKQILLYVSFRRSQVRVASNAGDGRGMTSHERRQFGFVYQVKENELKLRNNTQALHQNTNSFEETEVIAILTAQAQNINAAAAAAMTASTCCIWPCIRAILDISTSSPLTAM